MFVCSKLCQHNVPRQGLSMNHVFVNPYHFMVIIELACILLKIFLPTFCLVYPEHYTFLTGTSVNGSSPTGNCSNVSIDDTMITCLQPTSSVLFDGRVPTLTELDGDMWASQLLTINTTRSLTVVIFDFTDTPGYFGIRRVEVVMFNCPQWGITSTTITLTGATARSQLFNPFASTSVSSLTSCESLVRVCLSIHITRPLIGLQFTHYQDSDWLHLAEVTFYGGNPNCPPNVILNPPTTTPPTTTVIPLPDTTTTTAITITSNSKCMARVRLQPHYPHCDHNSAT